MSNGDESRWRIPLYAISRPAFLPVADLGQPQRGWNVASRVRSDGVRQAGALSLPKRRVSLAPVPAQSACGPALPDFFVSRHPMGAATEQARSRYNDRVSLVRLGRPPRSRDESSGRPVNWVGRFVVMGE